MRHPSNPRDRDLFEEIFSDPHRAADAITHTVTLDGAPLLLEGPRTFSEADSPTVALEGTPPTPVSRYLERKRVRVILKVEGVEWLDYAGRLIRTGRAEDQTGTFAAATTGYYQGGEDAVKFGAKKEYNTTPTAALADMLGRLDYRNVLVPQIAGPDFVRLAEDAYQLNQAVGEGIDAVEDESKVIQQDTFLDVARVFPRPSVGRIVSPEAPVRWKLGREVLSFSATTRNEARFRDIGVIRQNPNGEFENLVTPLVRVKYPSGVELPPAGATYYEQITDESGTRADEARSLAISIAASAYPGTFDCQITLPYVDPRIEDYDVREVEVHDFETGETELYRVLIESQSREYDTPQMVLSGAGVIVGRRERVLRITPIPERVGVGGGSPSSPPSYGYDPVTDELWFDEGLSWLAVDPGTGEMVFDTVSGGAVTLSGTGDELVVSN